MVPALDQLLADIGTASSAFPCFLRVHFVASRVKIVEKERRVDCKHIEDYYEMRLDNKVVVIK